MSEALQTFDVQRAWNALQAQLRQDCGNEIDVDCIGERDFDEEGALTLRLPAARVLFLEDGDPKPLDNQGRSYTAEYMFAVLCADEDLSGDPQVQRDKSLAVAYGVCDSLIGARLVLGNGVTSDPVLYAGMRPLATALGMAYVVALKVGGTVQFRGRNAIPVRPEEGQNNG